MAMRPTLVLNKQKLLHGRFLILGTKDHGVNNHRLSKVAMKVNSLNNRVYFSLQNFKMLVQVQLLQNHHRILILMSNHDVI